MMKIPRLALQIAAFTCVVIIATIAFCATDANRHWKLEDGLTKSRHDFVGTIKGLTNLNPGDEVAAFNSAGMCFGIGTYDGTYYYLSMFQAEKGMFPGDFDILGFEPGDQVTFKAHVSAEKEGQNEYFLTPAEGQQYVFVPHGTHGYPPKWIHLEFTDDGSGTGPGPDPGPGPTPGPEPAPEPDPSSPGTTVLPGGIPYVRPTDETPGSGIPPVIREKIFVEEKAGAVLPGTAPAPPDYYREPPTSRTSIRKSGPSLPPSRKQVVVRTPYVEPEEPFVPRDRLKIPEAKPRGFRGWPLWLKLMSLLLLLILIALAARKLLQMQEEDKNK